MKLKMAVSILPIFALLACSQPQPPISRIDRVQPGDSALTCTQLAEQVGAMNKILGISNDAQGQAVDQSNTTGAVSATAGIGSALGGIPYLGSAIGLASAPARNQQASNQMQAEQDAADAKARKENLVALANAKNCYAAAASDTPAATAPGKTTKKK
jgi:hypothetical protein